MTLLPSTTLSSHDSMCIYLVASFASSLPLQHGGDEKKKHERRCPSRRKHPVVEFFEVRENRPHRLDVSLVRALTCERNDVETRLPFKVTLSVPGPQRASDTRYIAGAPRCLLWEANSSGTHARRRAMGILTHRRIVFHVHRRQRLLHAAQVAAHRSLVAP